MGLQLIMQHGDEGPFCDGRWRLEQRKREGGNESFGCSDIGFSLAGKSEDVRRARLLSLALSHLEKAHVTYTIDKHPMNYMRLQVVRPSRFPAPGASAVCWPETVAASEFGQACHFNPCTETCRII